jgi:uncharacterized Zn-binding protein involved in type VI secretion
MPAARVGDMVLQLAPHCHAPIHPPGPTPTAVPHPALPLPILPPGAPTVLIGGKPAARMGDSTKVCSLVPCNPGGPGVILKASTTVTIGGQPAARVMDMTIHPICAAPIPSLKGQIQPPGCPTVLIGG